MPCKSLPERVRCLAASGSDLHLFTSIEQNVGKATNYMQLGEGTPSYYMQLVTTRTYYGPSDVQMFRCHSISLQPTVGDGHNGLWRDNDILSEVGAPYCDIQSDGYECSDLCDPLRREHGLRGNGLHCNLC